MCIRDRDIPADGKVEKDYQYASQLIAEIKAAGDFCIGAACYPEGHVELSLIHIYMLNTEAMTKVHVAYGTIVGDIKEVSRSYKEAKMALDVGKIFYLSLIHI